MDIRQEIEEAEYILIGLGEEFDLPEILRKQPEYEADVEQLKADGILWLKPYLEDRYRRENGAEQCVEMEEALRKLTALVEKKSYFVISTAMNRSLRQIPWKKLLLKKERFVAPCGDWSKKQCPDRCMEGLQPLTEADEASLADWYAALRRGEEMLPELGVCPNCGKTLILNNVCAPRYDEQGYMEQWIQYRNWLQNTMGHRLVILELGEGMRYPSVMRWPFEKIAFFQQKTTLYRVNAQLPQISEELRGKAVSIPENPIAWLRGL